jgi:photosystem II stability/assembly factor-like uncharacterized protein
MNFSTTSFFGYSIQKLIFIISLCVLSNYLVAQTTLQSVIGQNNLDKTTSFTKIQKAMDAYWTSQNVKNGFITDNGVSKKVPNWKIYKRWEYYWEQRVNQTTGEFPTTNSVVEYEKYLKTQNSLKKPSYNENWTNLGTNLSAGGYAGLGRINCVAFHPTDNNTFWVGSPSGGLWKTTNGGTSWTILNNSLPVIGVSDIIVPNNYAVSNTLYIATGDRDGGAIWSLGGGHVADNPSMGVLKSTDGGATWFSTGLIYITNQSKLVYRLLIHPTNNQILFAATSDGIYKTTNGGINWTLKTINNWIDMEFKPGDPTIMYASSDGYASTYINRSTDSGENWSFFSVAANGRRGEIAVTPNNPAVVYLLSANSAGGVYGVYKSINSGASFSVVNAGSPAGMVGYYTDGSGGNGGQGWYDWSIVVSPTDANTVFIGGVTTWKSTDGGVNWVANTCWTSYFGYNISGVPVTHADKHALVYQNSTTLFEGNDGGIYKTTNGGTSWTDLTNGLIISQVYRIGVSKTDNTKTLTGLQDNGSKLFNGAPNTWQDVYGGDGMECIIDNNNATSYMYVTYVNGEIHRNSNGFSTSSTTQISANIPGGQPIGAWVTPYVMHPTNSAILYAGYDRVWKTTDRGNSWTSVSQVLSSSAKLRSLAISPVNTNVLYAADQTNMWRTVDGGATNWSTVTLPTTSNTITYIAVKNNDPNTVWITYGGYDGNRVYQSTNGGFSWTNISSGLPNLPVMCIIHYKVATDRDVLFIGTDMGVFVKDGTNNWIMFSNGLPSVVVTELEIFYSPGNNKLRAGTYGRGLWETNIDAVLPMELSSFTAEFKNNSVSIKWTTETEVKNYGFEIERKSKNTQTDKWAKIGFVNGSGNSNSKKNYSFEDKNIKYGTYLYRLKQIDDNGQFMYSKTIEVFTSSIPQSYSLEQNFPNPFNPVTTILYQIKEQGLVQLKIYNLLGEEVITLVNEIKPIGYYSSNFDASDLPSGVYIYSLKVNDFVQTQKMTLLK